VPLVRISLIRGKPADYRRKVGDAVHRALVEAFGVPEQDRFQIITEHDPRDLVYDPSYLGIERSDELVMVQLTVSAGRSLVHKRALYQGIAAHLGRELGLRPQDAWVNLVEVAKENWSFGEGLASYAPGEARTA
jgi:phenylpyruvate tautomerase PptA (4-oxalocrotonate tautomerase family)